MGKVSIISCTHFEGPRLDVQLYWFEQALARMQANGVEAILHCGDVYDRGHVGSKEYPTPSIVNSIRKLVEKYQIPILFTEGNHDKNPAPYASAVAMLDRCPYFAHMGECEPFFLPIKGFENVMFVAVDWRVNCSTEAFLDYLQSCLDLTHAHKNVKTVVVYGHSDIQDVSHSTGTWPQPSISQLEELGEKVWVDRKVAVYFMFGHNHNRQCFEEANTWCVGALIRRTWGEKENPDGWFELSPDRGHVAVGAVHLNGPVYVDEHTLLCSDALPYGSVVRCLPEQIDRLKHNIGVKFEVITPQVERQVPTNARDTKLKVGMSPEEALTVWLTEQDKVHMVTPCLEELQKLTTDKVSASYPMRVESVSSVSVVGHRAGDLSATLQQHGWNVILGKSGMGKTTLLEATYAALFGHWPSPKRKEMWDAFNPDKDLTRVHVSFAASGHETVLSVDRIRDRGKAYVTVRDTTGPITEHTQVTKVQPLLHTLAGSPDVWLRTCFLCQDAEPDLVESLPADRFAALQKILGLDNISSIAANLAPTYKAAVEAARSHADYTGRIESRRSLYMAAYDVIQRESDAKIQHEITIKALECKLEFYNRQHTVVSTQAELAQINKELVNLNVSTYGVEDPTTEYERAQLEVKRLEALLAGRNSKKALVTAGCAANGRLQNVGCASNILPCPLINKAVHDRALGLEAAEELKLGVYTDLDGRLSEAQDSAMSWYALSNQYRNTKARLDYLQARKEQLANTLQACRPQDLIPEESKETLTSKLIAARVAYQQNTIDLASARVSLIESENAIKEYKSMLDTYQSGADRLPALEALQAAFHRSGIPRYLLEQALPGIQEELNRLLQTPGLEWLRINIDYPFGDSSQAVPTVLASVRGGHWVNASTLSGGQRALTRLLVRLAQCVWLSYANGARVLFLDEPTAAIDDELAGVVGELLKGLVGSGKAFNQGCLATHSDHLAAILSSAGGSIIHVG